MAAHCGQSPLAKGWSLIYQFTNFVDVGQFSYDVNNSATAPAFTRILYQMKYNEYSVWCEMDDFTGGNASRVGVPLSWTYEVDVTNVTVWVNNPGTGFPGANQATIYNRGPVNGRINFWPSNYGTAADGLYNHDDDSYSAGDGYGSMQVFDTTAATPECIFAWNYWGGANGGDAGIGSKATSHPDWTFTNNKGNFPASVCRIWVK